MQNWFLWLLVGIASVIGGFVALAHPFAATLAAEQLAGWMFTAIGILTLLSAFQDKGWSARIWVLLLGVLLTVFGFNLVVNPLEGAVRLTFIVAIMLAIIGVFRLVIAVTPMATGSRMILGLSGLISIALSAMIFTNFPWSSLSVLGIFLAIELISNGVSLIFVALDRQKPDAIA
jgi:uncharacterized membrane protein HdeD (DUF308 family)